MENLFDKYLIEKNINSTKFSIMMKCSTAAVYTWRYGKSRPVATHAWKIHKLTKGEVPITYWGYTIINGKIRRIDDGPITLEGT